MIGSAVFHRGGSMRAAIITCGRYVACFYDEEQCVLGGRVARI